MEAISVDLRVRICVACDEGLETRQEIAERFGVSRSFVQKLLRRRSKQGSIASLPHSGGRGPTLQTSHRTLLRQIVKRSSDATLAELCVELKKAGGPALSVPTMWRELERLRLPLKKSRCTPANVTRRGFGRCVGIGRSVWQRFPRRSRSMWTNRASTPR